MYVFGFDDRHVADELEKSLAEEQAHSRSLLLQLEASKASIDDDNRRRSDTQVWMYMCIYMYM